MQKSFPLDPFQKTPSRFASGLPAGDKFANMPYMKRTRPVSWIKAARKDFETFPLDVQSDILSALTMVADGVTPGIAKPLHGIDGGVFELALRHRGDAFRAVYALKVDSDIWVLHAFQKKSKHGIKTPLPEINLIRERLRRLQEVLR